MRHRGWIVFFTLGGAATIALAVAIAAVGFSGASAAVGQMGIIIAAAFGSEDLALIGTGLLIRNHTLNPAVGLLGAFLAIFLGDLALFALGRIFGRRALQLRWIARRIPAERVEAAASWFDRRGLQAMIAARFLPGTRLPMYLASGVIGKNARKVVLWTFLAALIWTPILVVSVAAFGEPLVEMLQKIFGAGPLSLLVAALVVVFLFHTFVPLVTVAGRRRFKVRIAKIHRWEFWPAWFFYLPVVPYFAWLVIRHRGLSVVTAVNPGIPQSGIVDESKAEILQHLPAEWTLQFFVVPCGTPTEQISSLTAEMAGRDWNFPLIFKPDTGYRGASVKLVKDWAGAEAYLTAAPGVTVVQAFHPGPYEAGVFYWRLPGQQWGRIYGITDKHFPFIIGDGVRTVEALIHVHPRYHVQATTFLKRHAAVRDKVLAQGERMPLAMAGNHCQGTMFKDGARLITPALEARIDAIAQHFHEKSGGFYFGRFDIRYSDPAAFMAGDDLAIVELNGVTSEPTHLYDPAYSLFRAYATLTGAWRAAFKIGAANHKSGANVTGTWELWRLIRRHYRLARPAALSD